MTPTAPRASDNYLIDTNVLLRSVEGGHPMHATALQAIQRLTAAGDTLWVAPQNLIEFWAVATRPRTSNGLGLAPAQAATELANFKAAFRLLPETPPLFTEWERLAALYNVCGKQAHDARLVAAMKVNQVGQILTFNGGDFSRYTAGESIVVVDPSSVVVSPP